MFSESALRMNAHAVRLQNAVEEICTRGQFTRLEPCSILIETRRLLEHLRLRSTFPVVALYADWCAHTRLDRNSAAAILFKITEALNRELRHPSDTSIDALYHAVRSALGIRALQPQLIDLFGRVGVKTSPVIECRMYCQFIGAVLDTIAELPLEFPKDIAAQRSGKIKKAYDAALKVAGEDPRRMVTHCSVTNNLSDQQLAFYGVPKGTYLWQIGTAGDSWICGVL